MIKIENLQFSYKEHKALCDVSFSVAKGEIFGLLGPNGSGKTTLFRILSTAMKPMKGSVKIGGLECETQFKQIRKKIGVVFQSPSLDGKLSVGENLMHQGHLYSLSGKQLSNRMDEMLQKLGVKARAKDRVDTLSGGLKRRVEIAKALMHAPELLILDEPSTGLDPGARIDMWRYLSTLSCDEGVTIIVTTHWMEEAERCDRIGILNHGKLISLGKPEELKAQMGGDVLLIECLNGAEKTIELSKKIEDKFHRKTIMAEGKIQIEHTEGAGIVPKIVEAFPGEIKSITFRRPSLDDVFVHHTGHQFWSESEERDA